jgi:hypothetical protein
MTEQKTVPPQSSTDPQYKDPRGDEKATQATPNPPAADTGGGNQREDKDRPHQPHEG